MIATKFCEFSPSAGIRQGDPLSPFLFILAMEIFSLMINKEVSNGSWKPFKIKDCSFSHLLFADDVLLFCRTDKKSLLCVKSVLDSFLGCSGLKINPNKSSLWFSSNSSSTNINLAESILLLPRHSSLGSYLGFPLGISHRKSDFKPIVKKITGKFESWKAKFLSPAGKTTLIKSVCTPTADFFMQCLPFPKSSCYEIDKAYRNFFWSAGSDKGKMHMISWDKICSSKRDGGLGLYKCFERNCAYLAKLTWRASNESESVWAKVFCHSSKLKSQASNIISRSYKRAFPIIQEGSFKVLGNGLNTSFWFDSWNPLGPIRDLLCGPLQPHIYNLKVADMVGMDGSWAWEKSSFFIPHDIQAVIKAVFLDRGSYRDDRTVWRFKKDGMFNLKSAYLVASKVFNNYTSPNKGWVWKLRCHSRLKFFLWMLVNNGLPCSKVLFDRGISLSPLCPLCGSMHESCEHLFRECDMIKLVWTDFNLHSRCLDGDSFLSWLKLNASCDSPSFHSIPHGTLFIYCLWYMWKARNKSV